MSDHAITFYRLQACPFCERVTRTLQELGVDYRSRFVEPLHSERDVVERLSGKRTVPAIVDENTGVTMSESANIVDYLERTYGGEQSEGLRTSEDERSDSSGSERSEGTRISSERNSDGSEQSRSDREGGDD